ncbi:hypothetical protein DFH08DRAFT_801269 [Mycena albidolilacea]|uniref:Uncharacterized protein n=1 Tax=Mycena albidolilacea TaxID=1033008 RepID=A0AAD7AIR7_9AGAR|nr:hypothetical protein DFH08DRAFT_801269 [Mycena albidolilacea]
MTWSLPSQRWTTEFTSIFCQGQSLTPHNTLSNLHQLRSRSRLNVVEILAGDKDSKLVQYVVSLQRSMEDRSQAFKLLLRKVHQAQRNDDGNQWKELKLLGFLDAVQVFFSSIGFLTQSELDDWMDTLTTLCQSEGQALCESGAMKAFIIWVYQDWQGRPLMGDHMEDFHGMAKSISLSVEDINDMSWFTDLTISRSYRARI